MILRQLANAVREQSWFTVAVELSLIVVGVFLGIQVSNWNEARLDRQLEDQVLQRLIVDFRDIESDSLSRLSRYVRQTEDLRSLALQLDEVGENPDLAVLVPLMRATIMPLIGGGSATYQELLSTGNLRIIRSDALRGALSEFATRHESAGSNSRLNWDIAINNSGRLIEVTGLGIALEKATRERALLESELIKLLQREEDWVLQVGSQIANQNLRHANERRWLADARAVLRELGQEAEGGPAPEIVSSPVDSN